VFRQAVATWQGRRVHAVGVAGSTVLVVGSDSLPAPRGSFTVSGTHPWGLLVDLGELDGWRSFVMRRNLGSLHQLPGGLYGEVDGVTVRASGSPRASGGTVSVAFDSLWPVGLIDWPHDGGKPTAWHVEDSRVVDRRSLVTTARFCGHEVTVASPVNTWDLSDRLLVRGAGCGVRGAGGSPSGERLADGFDPRVRDERAGAWRATVRFTDLRDIVTREARGWA
jgi:hypothetical protein